MVKIGSIIARSHLGAAELARARDELEYLSRSSTDRTVCAALADVEERLGNTDAALASLGRAREGETNAALVRYYDRVRKRLLAHR